MILKNCVFGPQGWTVPKVREFLNEYRSKVGLSSLYFRWIISFLMKLKCTLSVSYLVA